MEKYKKVTQKQLKISALTRHETFELPGGLYFLPDIQDYFEYIIKT